MSPRGKHGPNTLYNYIEVHRSAMEQHVASCFVLEHDVAFEPLASDVVYTIKGRIQCEHGLVIDVRKFLEATGTEGGNQLVQTTEYTYHALLVGGRNIFRYCGPHEERGAGSSHHHFDHVHRYDVFGDGRKIKPPTILAEYQRPTLSEVIDELRDWYYQNAEAVAALKKAHSLA